MKPTNKIIRQNTMNQQKEFECMTLLEKVMFLYKKLTRKQNTLISGKNIMTINGTDILQSGNLVIQGGSSDGVLYINTNGESGTLTEEDIEKLNIENGNVVIVNDHEHYHKMYENNIYYAFVNVFTATTYHIEYKAIYINKERHTFTKEETIENVDYNDLLNQPKINGVTLSGNIFTSELGIDWDDINSKPTIPTKTSDLTNDSGFIDNTYHDNSKQDKLTAGANITIENNVISASGSGGTSNYNDLSNKPKINNVELTNNKSLNDLGIINFSGNYNDLSNKPSINNVSLSGNKTLSQLGIAPKDTVDSLTTRIIQAEEDIEDLETNKQDNLISGNNIKTINNNSILGSGNIDIQATINPSQTIDSSTTDVPSNNAVKTFVESFGTIQEVGSANGGTFIKFTNGILINLKQVNHSVYTTSAYFADNAGAGVGLGNQPLAFTQLFAQVVSAKCNDSRYYNCSMVTGLSNTSMGTAQLHRPGGNATLNGQIQVIAIGKWK